MICFSSLIWKTHEKIVGVNTSTEALKICETVNNLNLEFIKVDAIKLPFKNDSFNLIFLLSVIGYLNDPKIVVEEME